MQMFLIKIITCLIVAIIFAILTYLTRNDESDEYRTAFGFITIGALILLFLFLGGGV